MGISGFFNSAAGGSNTDGAMSGLFNVGITGPIAGHPSGYVSGFESGALNFGTGIAGLFSLAHL